MQGDLWLYLNDPESERDGYHSTATRELMAVLERIEKDATIARGLVALIMASLEKTAARIESRTTE